MASEERQCKKKRSTGEPSVEATINAAPPAQLHPSITSLHDTRRVAHHDGVHTFCYALRDYPKNKHYN